MAEDVAVTERIAAPAQKVYELLADLTRMGEWSPETTKISYLSGATAPAPGVRFKGSNRHGVSRWSTLGTIVAADEGREISWDVTFLGMPVARWGYRIESDGPYACTVTESWADKRGPLMKVLGMSTGATNRKEHNTKTMRETLRRLKTAAEAAATR